VVTELDLQGAPDGLLIHTAGFDHDAGVFRILDVWQTREQGEKFIAEKLNPIIERMGAQAAEKGDETFRPPSRETWYDLHDSMTGGRAFQRRSLVASLEDALQRGEISLEFASHRSLDEWVGELEEPAWLTFYRDGDARAGAFRLNRLLDVERHRA